MNSSISCFVASSMAAVTDSVAITTNKTKINVLMFVLIVNATVPLLLLLLLFLLLHVPALAIFVARTLSVDLPTLVLLKQVLRVFLHLRWTLPLSLC